ncbi:MAG TPA: TetR/AcrR family transcriptional regulator [Bacteroidota bacterium]|nr:TetR/AcrR family transcriptional regulator [Bacteroidota bacterium]
MKTQILDAAQRRFEQYGLLKVTMDEIAQDIGMGKASLYYYFPTKEALFKSVLSREHEGLLDRVTALVEDPAPVSEKLHRYVSLRLEHFFHLINLQVLELQISAKLRPVLRATFDEFAKRESKLLEAMIREGKADGELSVGSPESVAAAFLHVMQGLRLRLVRDATTHRWDPDALGDVRKEFALIAEILIRGMCTPCDNKGVRRHRHNRIRST